MSEKYNFILDGGEQVKPIYIFEGKAPEQPSIVPSPINIQGNLKAPGEFWGKRKTLYNHENCHILYSKENLEIVLNLDVSNPYPGFVRGELVLNRDLIDLQIGALQASPKEMARFLKMKRYFFKDPDEHRKTILELNNLKAKIDTEIEAAQDDRGNKRSILEKKVTSNINISFNLSIPIFQGYPSQTFKVEICLDSTDASITCWLESVELQDLKKVMQDKIFEEELNKFGELVMIEY